MKKVIRLSESELIRLVKRVIKEQSFSEKWDDDRMRVIYECCGMKYNPDGEQAHLFEVYPFLNELVEATEIFTREADWNEDQLVKAFEGVSQQDFVGTEKLLRCIMPKLKVSLGSQNPYVYLLKIAFNNPITGTDPRDIQNKQRVQKVLDRFGVKEKI